MSLRKFSTFVVTSARVHRQGDRLLRTAHRHEFDYEPRPGFLYVRSRAISSRTNDNFDHFPAEEIKKAYRTFVGKPVFVNHNNDNHRRARGVIVDAALHEDTNPDGSPDTWAEVLMEVDAVRFPKLAEAIVKKHIDRTSMGTDVAFSVCSVCNNKATSPLEYCQHIPALKGKKIRRTTASGTQEDVLCYEKCYGLGFFENSLLVEEPADPTAYFLGGVDTRGLEMAGVKVAMRDEIAGQTVELWTKCDGEWGREKTLSLTPKFHSQVERIRQRADVEDVEVRDSGGSESKRYDIDAFLQYAEQGGSITSKSMVGPGIRTTATRKTAGSLFYTQRETAKGRKTGPRTLHREGCPSAKRNGPNSYPFGVSDEEILERWGGRDEKVCSRCNPTQTTASRREAMRYYCDLGCGYLEDVDWDQVREHHEWHAKVPVTASGEYGLDQQRPYTDWGDLPPERKPRGPSTPYQAPYGGGDFEDGFRDAMNTEKRQFATEAYYEGWEYGSQVLQLGGGMEHTPRAASRRTAARASYTIIDAPGGTNWEMHIAGCGDLHHPKYRSALNAAHTFEADSWQDAVATWVDPELEHMGYTQNDVRVLPCAKSGYSAPVAPSKPLDPSVCPGTGTPAQDYRGGQNWAVSTGICPECGGYFGISRGQIARHKKPAPYEYGDLRSGSGKHIVKRGSNAPLCGAPGEVSSTKPLKERPVRGTCAECVRLWEQARTASHKTAQQGAAPLQVVEHRRAYGGDTVRWEGTDEAEGRKVLAEQRAKYKPEVAEEMVGLYRMERIASRRLAGPDPKKNRISAYDLTAGDTIDGREITSVERRHDKKNNQRMVVVQFTDGDTDSWPEDAYVDGDVKIARKVGYTERDEFGVNHWRCPHCERMNPEWAGSVCFGCGYDDRTTASRRVGYGEVRAPADVDTLRDEICPVCGEPDTYNGDECLVCGFSKPPEMFMDPDLEKAKEVDLRQEQGDDADDTGAAELRCDNCGHTFNGSPDKVTAALNAAFGHFLRHSGVEPWPLDPTPGVDPLPEHRQRQVADEPDADAENPNTEPVAGDTCPDCGEGTLHPVEDADPDADEAPTDEAEGPVVEGEEIEAEVEVEEDPDKATVEVDVQTADGDEDPPENSDSDSDEDDEDDEDDQDDPPWLKDKKKASRNRRVPTHEGADVMRPALAALADQQKVIDRQAKQIRNLQQGFALLARAAGVDKHPRFATLLKTADSDNPAQPIESPPAEQATQTTEEALGDVNRDQPAGGNATDDLEKPGLTSEQDVSADATTTVDSPEVVLDPDDILENQDVTKPVEGTEDPRPESETITETEVRVKDGVQTDTAFAETGWTNTSTKEAQEARSFASLRLARLRIEAGIEEGDDLTLGQTIASSKTTDEAIQAEIDTLARVKTARKASAGQTARSRSLVPQRAASVQRTVPSMAPQGEPQIPQVQAAHGVTDEEMLFE